MGEVCLHKVRQHKYPSVDPQQRAGSSSQLHRAHVWVRSRSRDQVSDEEIANGYPVSAPGGGGHLKMVVK